MSFNRPIFFAALGCGLVFFPSAGLRAQQSQDAAAKSQQPQGQDQEADPLKRERSDKEQFAAQKASEAGVEGRLQDMAGTGCGLHHLGRGTEGIQEPEQRRGARSLHRAVLAAPQSQSRLSGERVPRRALSAHRLCQRAFCRRQAGLEDGPRAHVYRLRQAGLDRVASFGRRYQRPMEEGGGETSTFPFETWHYRYIEGIGENIDLEFVDTCQCGDYHFTIDRGEKDALLHVPGAGQTQWEEMGMAKKADRFKGGFENLGTGPCRRREAIEGVRPHRTGGQAFRSAADQVQGSGQLYLRAQAAERAGVSRSTCGPTLSR